MTTAEPIHANENRILVAVLCRFYGVAGQYNPPWSRNLHLPYRSVLITARLSVSSATVQPLCFVDYPSSSLSQSSAVRCRSLRSSSIFILQSAPDLIVHRIQAWTISSFFSREGHKFHGMKSGVTTLRSSIVSRARRARFHRCKKRFILVMFYVFDVF